MPLPAETFTKVSKFFSKTAKVIVNPKDTLAVSGKCFFLCFYALIQNTMCFSKLY